MEKDHAPDSMATVNMKPDYPASEVYSTTSEAPPAYRIRQSNSVQITKIVAITVVVSSFILGSFILASSYLQVRASCEQLQQLDAVLEKELMLESKHLQAEALMQEEQVPHAEHLLAESSSNNINKDQKSISLADDTMVNEGAEPQNLEDTIQDGGDSNTDGGSSYSDNDSSEEDVHPIKFKLPLQLDFDELAGALMDKNQRSRMNCVVEKRKAEEVVDQQPRSLKLPFGINFTTDPKFQRVTGERMVIFCESGHETRSDDEPQPMVLPLHLTAPPQQLQQPQAQFRPVPHQPPQPEYRPSPSMPMSGATKFFPIHLPSGAMDGSSQAQMGVPQEVRVHVQRIAIPTEALRAAIQQGQLQVQQMPLAIGLQRVGMNEADFHAIQEAAESRFQREQEMQMQEEQPPQPPQPESPEMPRQGYGRSLMHPVHIPMQLMQQVPPQENNPERPHYVQPRSVRSVDDALLHRREKRVKRCACDCNC